ncbi:LIM domain and actin-binding protein 1 isoform X2 [Episyrphus balteatus]|uniref:LIM domain and actin-binding protein 1 isoform X2 n=1 Tax=Episyrphus balteatus TaxID=286459 RepID=UPI0024851E1E|nr:LIM domain and actin-binding protein 1 isoform X2 [Episyrphus balteatus]
MESNTQITNQLASSIVTEQQQQQQSIKTTKAKTTKTKASKKVISSNNVAVAVASATTTTTTRKAAAVTETTSNITSSSITTMEENVSSSNTVTVFENTANNLSLESKKIESSIDSSTLNQNGGDVPSENGVLKTKTVKMKSSGSSTSLINGKKQSKKVKKSNSEKENISVKSSFSKFDALQKRNLIHDANAEKKQDCRVCQKEVYKMEEIKAEKNIYHKNCFRCHECEKQLKVDNYQSHEGILYCKAHFKSLFMPKVVEETAQDKPKKPELIIRENQPLELPPDVVRASDKPDLGLEELQQINIRSKFEAFEKSQVENDDRGLERTPSITGVKRSASILSKLAKFQAKSGVNCVNGSEDHDNIPYEEESESDDDSSDGDGAESDPDLVRAKRSQRERPVGLGNMNDIKSKFETGHIMSKEERREERKQEIQNIRSRLFMGKQARIKEMYQQAVAESEHGITSIGKKSEIDIGDKARCLKEKFEKGEIFKEHDENPKVAEDELEVFESAISKRSRSLFQELDASAAKNQLSPRKRLSSSNENSRNRSFDDQNWVNSNLAESIVKHDEKVDDVQVETSDISSKFKFFETYKPAESEKKTFRITPPREGVVKLATPESDEELINKQTTTIDTEPVEKAHTATIMLSKFRELEQTINNNKANLGPRPLKCFTPPPDNDRRVYIESESDVENMSEEEEEDEEDYEEEGIEEEDSEYNGVHVDARSRDHLEDEALIQAQSAARAKKLRAKFEKWEASEIQREIQDGTINLYEDNSEENQIESAKAIRAKFENMKETQLNQPTRPRYKVNRFV